MDISTFIALAAFLFSFGTTIVSYRRSNKQDIHNLRTELRGLLQRLAALPKENMEIIQKYASDPNAVAVLSGYVNQENLLLAKQAADVITRLPQNQVSATDYLAVAQALQQSRAFTEATANFRKALAAAKLLDDEVAALRMLAGMEIVTGKIGDGRVHFQQALDLFGKHLGYDEVTKNYTNFLTELQWSWAELYGHAMDAAKQHFNQAEHCLGKLPSGPQTEIMKGQLNQLRTALSANGPADPSAAPGMSTLAPLPTFRRPD
jgi:tetratricopeptide (TPR) repeat protein